MKPFLIFMPEGWTASFCLECHLDRGSFNCGESICPLANAKPATEVVYPSEEFTHNLTENRFEMNFKPVTLYAIENDEKPHD